MKRRNRLRKILIRTAIGVVSLVLLGFLSLTGAMVLSRYRPAMQPIVYQAASLESWPTQGWQVSTPEEQGMDSARLLEMVDFYEQRHAKNEQILIDSVTVVRNGSIVADIYLNPLYPPGTKHIIHSCTKSVMSTLVGIAIEQGYIESVDVPVLEIFADKGIENPDERLRDLTLGHLLTMQTGLHSQDSYLYGYAGLFEMQRTEDWTEYILHLPLEVAPGTRFDYSNMASFLLSAVLTEASGMDTLAFARQHLFEPLGIRDVQWERSPQGVGIGWARMWLKPHDMAKIGLLYLQNGSWGDEQIVPAHWIEDSLTAHSQPKKYRYVYNDRGRVDYMVSGGSWVATNLVRPFADGYGYQWWLDRSGSYTALGTGGQYIMVVPDENLVVVFTSKLGGEDAFLPARLLDDYILPAILSDEALPANEAAQQRLSSLSEPPDLAVAPQPVPELPVRAQDISGVTYSLEANLWRYDLFQLVFDPTTDYAEFSYTVKAGEEVHYQVGLDNTHRLTETGDGTYAAVGSWTTPDTFVIEYELIGYSTLGRWVLTFDGEGIVVEEVGVTGVYSYGGRAIDTN